MNIYKNKTMNAIISWLLTKYKFPKFIFKKLSDNWTDNHGNNLYHYASFHHDNYLFEKAKENKADINQLNQRGFMPIHTYMECGFPEKILSKEEKREKNKKKKDLTGLYSVKSEDKRIIDFNLELLDLLVKEGANINAFIQSPKREGQWGEGVSTNSRRNIRGSAVELLICLFWENVLHSTFNDETQVEKYTEVYNKLESYGANINLIIEKSIWDETEVIRDAMQEINSVIVSHYFIRYISNEKDLIAIRPLLNDKSLNFGLADDNGNTVLHYLFSRLNERERHINPMKIIELFIEIIYNPAFDEKYLKIKNGFRLEPLMNLKREKNDLRQEFEKLLLKKRLESKLDMRNDKKKVQKI